MESNAIQRQELEQERALRAMSGAVIRGHIEAEAGRAAPPLAAFRTALDAELGRTAEFHAANFACLDAQWHRTTASQVALHERLEAESRRIQAAQDAARKQIEVELRRADASHRAVARLEMLGPTDDEWRSFRALLAAIETIAANAVPPVDVSELLRYPVGLLELLVAHHPEGVPMLPRGRPLGDLLTICVDTESGAERYRAARRLALEHFRFKYVFARERRSIIRPALQQWKGERSWDDAWVELVTPLLFIAVEEFRDGLVVSEAFQRVRCHLRRGIEVELFGYSTDSRAASEVPLADDWQPPDAGEILELTDLRLDLLLALKRLPADDASLVMTYYAGGTDRPALAASLGIGYDTLRKRVERIRNRLAAGVELVA